MSKMTKEKFEIELQKIRAQNTQKEYRKMLKSERKKNSIKRQKIETSKLLAVYLFALLNAIVIYAMVAMWNFADLSYLGVLISDIAAQVVIYAIYCLKAYKGKKQQGIMELEQEKLFSSREDDSSEE